MLTVAVILGMGTPRTVAAELTGHARSLSVVPADAAFYVAMLKNRQQITQMTETKAWKKFVNIPIVNIGVNQVITQWQFPQDERLLHVRDWVQGPEGRAILGLLRDAGSEEVVLYGDKKFATVLELLMDFNSEMNQAQAEMMRNLESPEPDVEEILNARMQEFLKTRSNDLDVPTFVLAGRIVNEEQATGVLDILEEHLDNIPPQQQIDLAESIERETSGTVDLLTLTLTGDLLPWGQIESDMVDNPELYALLREVLYDKQVVIAVGRVDDFFVLSVGPSIEHFTKAHSGKRLVETDEFQRLAPYADKEIVSLGYFGGDMMKTLSSNERSLRDLSVTLKGLLSLSELDPLRKEAIEKDIDELTSELIAYLPDASTVVFASFMTDRGYESISYNWAKLPPTVDGSKPLTLIDHVGSDSLAWFVSRGKQSVDGYDRFTSWLRRIHVHLESIAQTTTSVEDWENYERVREEIVPLLNRLDRANREQFLPAAANGQGALILTASPQARRWCDHMPEAPHDLPLPTLALLYGIDDPMLVKQGAAEYFSVAQQALDIAHRMNPVEVESITIPKPEVTSVTGGELFSYALPAQLGGSDRIAPNAALGKHVLVLSLLPEIGEKLLAESRPVMEGPLGDLDRPLVSASHIETARFVDVLKPWIDYGVQVAMQKARDEGGQTQQAVAMVGFIKPSVHEILDVLKVFHSTTTVTYIEGDVVVRHTESRTIDLED